MPLVTTVRGAPSGKKIKDGHRTTLAFALDPDVSFWEKTGKPPGVDGGDAVEQTTMHNDALQTFAPQKLKRMTEVTGKAAVDAKVIPQLIALCNVEGSITAHLPAADSVDFFGFLKSFDFDEFERGKQPEGTYTIVVTNVDPETGAETLPVYNPPP